METENTMTNLFEALAAAQGDMKNAGFDSQNPHFKNQYASLAAVRDAVIPALSKHGIAVTQITVLDPFHLVTTLHKGDQSISSQWPLSLAKPQEMGSQLTYARRYCLLAICGINGDVDDDAEEAKTAPKPGSTVRATVKNAQEMKGDQKITELKANLRSFAEQLAETTTTTDLDDLLVTFQQTIDNAKQDLPSWWATGEGMPEQFVPLADRVTALQERLAIQGA